LILLAVILSRLLAKARWLIAVLLVTLCCLTGMQTLNYANEESLWRATIRTNPDAWLARNNLAILLRQRGEIDAVELLMQEAIRRTPNAIEPRLNIGQLMMELGKPAQAVTHFQVVLDQIPDDRRALLGIAQALEQVGDKQAATAYFKQTVTVYEQLPRFLNSPRGWMNHARALEGCGQLEQALQRYEQGAQQYVTTVAEAYQRMGMIQLQMGHTQQALTSFERSAKEGQSASVESIHHWAWLLATHPDSDLRDGNKALQLAIKLCKLTKNRAPRYLDTLAAASAEVGRYPQAITVQTQAIGLAKQAGFTELVTTMTRRLTLYQNHKPYRDTTMAITD
ncbi:MAG: tetratricopeptide repeat protein, partial [Phycisphaeraceae bacterium]|nr:tetratricopeptide repeat protein [Phycisphaeraceae bacterium]